MSDDSIDVKHIVKIMKKHYVLIFLVLFLLFGFYLRVQFLDFPYVGYHNMKEHETLDPIYFFQTEGEYLHKQAFAFYGLDEGEGYHEEYGR